MKKLAILITITLLSAGCSSYSVNTEINESSKIDKCKKSGILFHIPNSSRITLPELEKSLDAWLMAHKRINKMSIIKSPDPDLAVFRTELDRFHQVSADKSFLEYKSLGVIRQYISGNETKLQELMENNGLDSLVIYEVDGYYSPEMQFIDLKSLISIVDKDLKVIYMDYQRGSFDVDEFDPERVKSILLDKINRRFLEKMLSFDFIED